MMFACTEKMVQVSQEGARETAAKVTSQWELVLEGRPSKEEGGGESGCRDRKQRKDRGQEFRGRLRTQAHLCVCVKSFPFASGRVRSF